MNALFDRRLLLAAFAGAAMTASFAEARPQRRFFAGKRKIGLQLYTLGDEPAQDLDGTLAKVARIGYRDLQLPGLFGKSPTVLRAAADRVGAKYSAIHLAAMGLDPAALTLLSPTQRIVDDLGVLGIRSAVLPIMILPDNFREAPGATFPEKIANSLANGNGDNWKKTAALLNEKAAALQSAGITVGYHNHNVEFAPIGNTTGWDILMAETDPALVRFEIDLGWIAAAGRDPATFLEGLKGRVRWLHLKDLRASTQTNFALRMDPTEVGSGKQDWPRILRAAAAAGVEHYYVEQEPPFTMARIDAAAKSYGFLSQLRA